MANSPDAVVAAIARVEAEARPPAGEPRTDVVVGLSATGRRVDLNLPADLSDEELFELVWRIVGQVRPALAARRAAAGSAIWTPGPPGVVEVGG